MTGPKVTLLAEKCWLIKRIQVDPTDNSVKDVSFVESYKQFNRSPVHATIFTSVEAAEQMIWLIEDFWKRHAPKGNMNGTVDHYEWVSYYDEVVNGPYGTRIELKKE